MSRADAPPPLPGGACGRITRTPEECALHTVSMGMGAQCVRHPVQNSRVEERAVFVWLVFFQNAMGRPSASRTSSALCVPRHNI